MNISYTYILEKGFSRFSIVGESEILSKYGKTYHNDSISQGQMDITLHTFPSQSWKKKPSVSMALTSLLQKETSSSTNW